MTAGGACAQATSISIIIPALNEAAYLGGALDAVHSAFAQLPVQRVRLADLLVVDNGSEDATAEVARQHGARVIREPERGVARARNAGARAATGSVLVFVDADTVVPPGFGVVVAGCAADAQCMGGAFDTEQRPRRRLLRLYLRAWRVLGRALDMAQGAAQFCRRDAFIELGGYDERLHMGEDVDFFWRLKRLARERGMHAELVRTVRVRTSARRFDEWPVWRTLLWTNPLVAGLLRRNRAAWRGWHGAPPR